MPSWSASGFSWPRPRAARPRPWRASWPRYKGGDGWVVTDQFLLRSTFFSFDVLRLSDLLWAYKKVTKHSVNFIPTGKTYDAVLACYGGSATVKGAEKTVDALLGFAAQ